jgi:hypothetical protein
VESKTLTWTDNQLDETVAVCAASLRDVSCRLKDGHLRLLADQEKVNVLVLSCSLNKSEISGKWIVNHNCFMLTDSEAPHPNTIIIHHRCGGGGAEYTGGHWEAVLCTDTGNDSNWSGSIDRDHKLIKQLMTIS